MSVNAMLPTACRCGALAGVIADDSVICSSCGAERASLSPIAKQFLAGIAEHFGDPDEPIVFRRPDAAKAIEQQDAQLKRKLTSGKSHYDIITDNIGEQNVRADDDNADRTSDSELADDDE
jgi:hypothetical protein